MTVSGMVHDPSRFTEPPGKAVCVGGPHHGFITPIEPIIDALVVDDVTYCHAADVEHRGEQYKVMVVTGKPYDVRWAASQAVIALMEGEL